MGKQNKVLVIDAGNTSIKAGYFLNGKLIEVKRFDLKGLPSLVNWGNELQAEGIILASVLIASETLSIQRLFPSCLLVDKSTSLPISIVYKSPDTLGVDRICNAVYCAVHSQTEFAVSIDIGTCIKFDLVQKNQGYIGGSISPGIDLRYKSLNDYTGNLPLISNKSLGKLVGTETDTSIQAGVMQGINAEIEGLMSRYTDEFTDLTFFMTGGDASFFDIHSKNDIFADENLTIKGLYEIYKHNA